jgi:hypothetical protein
VDPLTVRSGEGVVPRRSEHVFRECGRDGAERCCTNDDELGPSKEEGGNTAPPFPYIDVNAAGFRIGARDLGQRERTAQGDEATEHPERQHWERPRQAIGDACG